MHQNPHLHLNPLKTIRQKSAKQLILPSCLRQRGMTTASARPIHLPRQRSSLPSLFYLAVSETIIPPVFCTLCRCTVSLPVRIHDPKTSQTPRPSCRKRGFYTSLPTHRPHSQPSLHRRIFPDHGCGWRGVCVTPWRWQDEVPLQSSWARKQQCGGNLRPQTPFRVYT